mmetsp:Transcript_14954/g.46336  ORF Transcript_14954/g.46336 Transcript_14954/m.46336 type:complete len:233 (-) Transcript_14954:255-953(-)
MSSMCSCTAAARSLPTCSSAVSTSANSSKSALSRAESFSCFAPNAAIFSALLRCSSRTLPRPVSFAPASNIIPRSIFDRSREQPSASSCFSDLMHSSIAAADWNCATLLRRRDTLDSMVLSTVCVWKKVASITLPSASTRRRMAASARATSPAAEALSSSRRRSSISLCSLAMVKPESCRTFVRSLSSEMTSSFAVIASRMRDTSRPVNLTVRRNSMSVSVLRRASEWSNSG